jgi:hypothetical protein
VTIPYRRNAKHRSTSSRCLASRSITSPMKSERPTRA